MNKSKPISGKKSVLKIIQIQNVEYVGKWWCMALADNGKAYMASCSLKTGKWSDWREVISDKK